MGTYYLANGTIGPYTPIMQVGSILVGIQGRGEFSSSGVFATNSIGVGILQGAAGTVTAGSGTGIGTFTVLNGMVVGFSGAGTFIQEADNFGYSRVDLTGTSIGATLGVNPGGTGYYKMAGGRLFAHTIQAGLFGSGTFRMAREGTRNDTPTAEIDTLQLATQFSGTGQADVTAGTLQGVGCVVGVNGAASFNLSGNGFEKVDYLSIGDQSGALGQYTMSGGALTCTAETYVGQLGNGSFTQTGGVHVANTIFLGYSGSGRGTFTINSATASLEATQLVVGRLGIGTFIQQNGRPVITAPASASGILIGNGNAGTYLLQGGTLDCNANIQVGTAGFGTFIQSGGTLINGTSLNLGLANGSYGYFRISGGTASIPSLNVGLVGASGSPASGDVVVGGTGRLVVTSLNVGPNAYTFGTVTLNGGSLLASEINLGNEFTNGVGVMVVNAGSAEVTGAIKVRNTNSFRLFLEGGTLTVGTLDMTGDNFAFDGGMLRLTPNGGADVQVDSNTPQSPLPASLGSNASTSLIIGKSGSNPWSTLKLGTNGNGTLSQIGGLVQVNGGLLLGTAAGHTGKVTLSGGSVISSQSVIAEHGRGGFAQTGGTHIAGPLPVPPNLPQDVFTIATFPGSIGTYSLSGTGSLLVNGDGSIGGFHINGTDMSGGAGSLGIGPGGSARFTGTLRVFGTGITTLDSGSLTVGTLELMGAPSRLTWTSGTLSITGNSLGMANVEIDSAPTQSAVAPFGSFLNLGTGKTLGVGSNTTSASTTRLQVGSNGGGSLSVNGGSVQVKGALALASVAGHTGAVLLASGTVNSAQSLIGEFGTASFTQTGGSHTITSQLAANTDRIAIAAHAGSEGTYTLNAPGSLQVSGDMSIGGLQTSGVAASGGNGTFLVNNAAASISGSLRVYDAGSFVMNGGSVSVGSLIVSGQGRASLLDGTLIITSTLSTQTPATNFNWSAGTLVFTGGVGLTVGPTGPLGSSYAFGPGQNLRVTNVEYVGGAPAALLTQTGGTNAAARSIVGFNADGGVLQSGGVATINLTQVGWGTGSGSYSLGGTLVTNTLEVGGNVNPGVTGRFTVNGSGSLSVTADAFIGGSSTAAGGAATLALVSGTPSVNVTGRLKVWPNGAVNYDSGSLSTATLELVDTARIVLGPGSTKALRTTALVMPAATSRIDLGDAVMIIDYAGSTPIDTIRGLISAGRNGGDWLGNGITSSPAAATAGAAQKTALGFAEATELFTSFPATFAGQTVDNTSVLIRYVLYGDANLDKVVNISDFSLLATNFNTATIRWNRGDFNYDGVDNIADFALLAANFNLALPADPQRSAIPEPCSLFFTAAVLIVRQRR